MSLFKTCVKSIFRCLLPFLMGSKVLLWVKRENRERIKVDWGKVLQLDFSAKYIKLIEGLDTQSVRTVNRILTRQTTILASNAKFYDLYTTDEQQGLRELKENLNDQILQISDDLFAWKNYLLPIKSFGAPVFYYKYGMQEVETIARIKGKTIMDVGGFIGDSALIFEELEPDKIYAFEPSPDTFELMKKTLELNGLKNVIPENLALGAEKGECTLYVDNGDGQGTGIIKKGTVHYSKEIKVPLMTLDDYVADHKIENIGLIKADIEGAEPDFLAGAKKTISEQKPILLICIYHNAHDFFEIKPLIESWNLGYRFKIYRPILGGAHADTLLIAEIV